MMLTVDTHGPGTMLDEVPIVGGRILLALSDPGDRLIMLSSCADPALAQLDAAAVDALIVALGDVRGRMINQGCEDA